MAKNTKNTKTVKTVVAFANAKNTTKGEKKLTKNVATKGKNSKPAVKNAAKKNGKPETTRKPRAKKDGLRVGQTRILEALAKIKGKGGMTCVQLSEIAANGHEGWTRHFLGSDKPEGREVNRKYLGGKETLQCLNAVERFDSELDSRKVVCYRITAKGREILKAQLKLDNAK